MKSLPLTFTAVEDLILAAQPLKPYLNVYEAVTGMYGHIHRTFIDPGLMRLIEPPPGVAHSGNRDNTLLQ